MEQKVLNGFNVKTLQATSEYVKADKKEAERIRTENHQYFFIGLPVNMSKYEFPNNKKGMTDRQFRQWVEENRPQTPYMSFVLFKIVKFTPMGIAGGIFTSPKVVPTSLIVETMDGRQMEAYQLYTETYGRQVLRISDAVLREVAKSFVHPKLNMDNFHNYSPPIWYAERGEPDHVYVNFGTCNADYIAREFANWKEGKPKMKAHFDSIFPRFEAAQASQRAQQQNIETEKARYREELEKAFGGGGNNASGYSIYACPSCATKCRVPVRGKKTEITCPKCGRKFVVFC